MRSNVNRTCITHTFHAANTSYFSPLSPNTSYFLPLSHHRATLTSPLKLPFSFESQNKVSLLRFSLQNSFLCIQVTLSPFASGATHTTTQKRGITGHFTNCAFDAQMATLLQCSASVALAVAWRCPWRSNLHSSNFEFV